MWGSGPRTERGSAATAERFQHRPATNTRSACSFQNDLNERQAAQLWAAVPGKTDDERSAESVATYTPAGDEFGAVAFAQFVAKHKASDRIVVAPGNYSVSVGYPGHSHIVLGSGSATGPLSNLEIDFTAVFLLVRRTSWPPPPHQ